METSVQVQPVKKRIQIIDIIRGVSIAGISLANASLMNTTLKKTIIGGFYFQNDSVLDKVSSFVLKNLIYQKFTGIFVFLFGLSLFIFNQSLHRQGLNNKEVMKKRFLGIFVIGLLQTIFIWWGDILTVYGMLGLLLIPMMEFSPKKLLQVCGFVLLLILASQCLMLLPFMDNTPFFENAKEPDLLYSTLNFWQIIPHRIMDYIDSNYTAFFYPRKMFLFSSYLNYILRLFFFMVLGLYFGKKGFFTDLKANRSFFFKVGASSLLLAGIFLTAKILAGEKEAIFSIWLELSLPLFYLSLIVFMAQSKYGRSIFLPFAKIGKMTLTNYLLINLSLSLILYGYGLSFYGKISMFSISMITIVIYIVYSFLSYLYLSVFSLGPVEWVLRKWTYSGASRVQVESKLESTMESAG